MAWLTKCLLPLYILGTFILISYLLNFFPAKDFSLNISGVNDSSKLIFRFSFNNSLPRDVNETSLSFSMSSFIISLFESRCNDLISSISFNPVSFTNEDSLVCLDNNGRAFLSKGVKDSINLECFEEGSLIPVKNSFFISSMFLGNSFPKYFDFFKYLFPSLTVWNKYQYSLPFILTFFT